MSDATRDPGTAQEIKTRNQLLTRAEKDPKLALENGWYHDPAFCLGFFDRCQGQALADSPMTLELARRAVEMAATNGAPHLENRGMGVLVHAYVARFDLFWAGKTLEEYRAKALDCCPGCRSDFFFREGDLRTEERKPGEALRALRSCLEEGDGHLDADGVARALFVRGIAHHYDGCRRRAMEDAGRTLLELSLGSPRSFFHDAVAFLAIFNGGGGPEHDVTALEYLTRFDARIQGRDGWQDVRARKLWAEGHLYARLGDLVRARRRLERAHKRILVHGWTREVTACGVDVAQIRCRKGADPTLAPLTENVRIARRALVKSLETRPDLDEDYRSGLEAMIEVLDDWPENAFDELGAFRRSFIAPVPSGLAERIGRPDRPGLTPVTRPPSDRAARSGSRGPAARRWRGDDGCG
ncbi:MAG TPA: hypothetical protein VGG06_27400 [Thermoanaerobaculia bacterium]|jgi:hypothetical protein